jgi:hypothetical protein
MSALFGLRTVINFIMKLHGFLAGEEALAQPRPLLALHRILLLILQQTNNQLNAIHHPDTANHRNVLRHSLESYPSLVSRNVDKPSLVTKI